MLLNRDTAEGIANGSITVVLRHCNVVRAKAGGTQRTSAGTIRIDVIEVSYLAPEATWTLQYLELIAANEAVRAPDLAARLGLETQRTSGEYASSRGSA